LGQPRPTLAQATAASQVRHPADRNSATVSPRRCDGRPVVADPGVKDLFTTFSSLTKVKWDTIATRANASFRRPWSTQRRAPIVGSHRCATHSRSGELAPPLHAPTIESRDRPSGASPRGDRQQQMRACSGREHVCAPLYRCRSRSTGRVQVARVVGKSTRNLQPMRCPSEDGARVARSRVLYACRLDE